MLASAVACLVMAQSNSASVAWDAARDWKTPVVSLRKLASEVSARTGRSVIVASDVPDLNVYVNVRGKSAAQVLDMVGYATTTRWRVSEETVTIVRTREDVASEEARFATARMQWIKAKLAASPAASVSQDSYEQELEQAKAIMARLRVRDSADDMRALKRWGESVPHELKAEPVAHRLGSSFLATLRPGRPVVFSSHPTRLQRALPPAVEELVSVMRRASALVHGEWEHFLSTNGSWTPFASFLSEARLRHILPARLVVVCSLMDDDDSVIVTVKSYDESGGLLKGSTFQLEAPSRFGSGAEEAEFSDFPETLQFSTGLTDRMNELSRGLDSGVAFESRRAGLEMISRQEIGRNGITVLSEVLDEYVARRGDLVIESPGQAFGLGHGECDLGGVLAYVFEPLHSNLKKIHGATVGRVNSPRSRYDHFLPDGPLAVFASCLLEQRPFTLDDLADAAAACRTWIELEMLPDHYRRMTGGKTAPMNAEAGIPLRAYGLLRKSERERVRSQGLSAPLSSFSQEFRSYLGELIEQNRFIPGDHAEDTGLMSLRPARRSDRVPRSNYEALSTVFRAMPDSVPILVRMYVVKKPKLFVIGDQGEPRELTAREAGQWQAIGEVRRANGSGYPGTLTGFAEVEAESLRLDVTFGGMDPSSRGFPYIRAEALVFKPLAQMPEALKREFRAGYEAWMEIERGRGQRKLPPPIRQEP